MNKLVIDMRTSDLDELLVALHAFVVVDGVRTCRAVRADEIKGEVEEITSKGDLTLKTRRGEVDITLLQDAPKKAVDAYLRLRGI
jgi:hypothetical protein